MTGLERIMHIEDDPSIQEVARVALEVVGGFNVRSCASGAEGVAGAESFAPQLVLLDVMMPGMDGPQTLEKLRELPCMDGVPVIFMTAKAQVQEVDAYRALGAAGVIVKPFDPMTLPDQIRQIWEQQHD
ncbi:response regulator [Halopseudomonas pachastrellae]|uniref:response regulator n=1 Tax=Halopseudomonas pachastrellae TaxID=254161 RepID=UPI003D7C5967|tara:strand:- start:118 stop:504 length:387 start_codon:yes stop_codon:yes gene_type:complete